MDNKIKIGAQAPRFKTVDIWGAEVNSTLPNKWIYLSFHRFAACPFCNLRTNELINSHEKFKKHGIEIISVWPSSTVNMLQFVGNKKSPFPLVSDATKTIFEQYGVTKSSKIAALKMLLKPSLIYKALKNKHKKIITDADPSLMPASFLIDPLGIIKLAHYAEHYGDHVKISKIISIVQGNEKLNRF